MNSLLSITLLLKSLVDQRLRFFFGLNSEMASEGAFRVVLRRALMVGAWGDSEAGIWRMLRGVRGARRAS